MLNKESLVYYDQRYIESPGHMLLKEGSHLDAFDAERFAFLTQKHAKYNVWMGTHAHPKDLLTVSGVERILYMYCGTVESKCLLSLRHLAYAKETDVRKIETLLAQRWFWQNKWQEQVSDPRVVNVDVYHFYASSEYRESLFKELGEEANEALFADWFAKNDHMHMMQDALQVYGEMLTRPSEYMTV